MVFLSAFAGLTAVPLRAQVPTVLPTPTPGVQPAATPPGPPPALPGDKEIAALAQQTLSPILDANSVPPPPPTGFKAQVIKEGVFLEWEPATPSLGLLTYNVYRSQFPGGGYNLINAKPVTAAHFLDGGTSSLDPPKEGETYFYVAASVDAKGQVSPYSEEVNLKVSGLGVGGGTPPPEPGQEKGKVKEKAVIASCPSRVTRRSKPSSVRSIIYVPISVTRNRPFPPPTSTRNWW